MEAELVAETSNSVKNQENEVQKKAISLSRSIVRALYMTVNCVFKEQTL
jgi:hypothetical protein